MTNWILMPVVNNEEQTTQALSDCLLQTLPDTHILVINQAMGREGDWMREAGFDRRIHFWHHSPPLPSLSATWNAALRFVWESGEDHALVVNNDVRLSPQLYATLIQAQRQTGAWFLTACNVGEAAWPDAAVAFEAGEHLDLRVRGGPDFSCFLITRECHRWFQFDEGFIPAYHEDNDYHRRLQLAGVGDKIFSVCVPYLHYGSGTLNADPAFRASWGPKFAACQEYYKAKWGGLPGQETLNRPFHAAPEGIDARPYMLGQGKADVARLVSGSYPWESGSTS